MGTHTISNSSTFRGWLESMGVDDMIFDPCGCIFGETEPAPVPIPGAPFNRQMSQRRSTHSASTRASQRSGSTRNGKNPAGRTQSHEVPEMVENHSASPFSTILNIVGVTTNPPHSVAGWVAFQFGSSLIANRFLTRKAKQKRKQKNRAYYKLPHCVKEKYHDFLGIFCSSLKSLNTVCHFELLVNFACSSSLFLVSYHFEVIQVFEGFLPTPKFLRL